MNYVKLYLLGLKNMVSAKQKRARALFSKAVKQAKGKSQAQRKSIFKKVFGKRQTRTSNQAGVRVRTLNPVNRRVRIKTQGGIKVARGRTRKARGFKRSSSSNSGLMSKPASIIGAVAVVSVLEQPLRDLLGNVLPAVDVQAVGINLVDVAEGIGGWQLAKRGRSPFAKAMGITFMVLGISKISTAVLGNVGGLFGGGGAGNGEAGV